MDQTGSRQGVQSFRNFSNEELKVRAMVLSKEVIEVLVVIDGVDSFSLVELPPDLKELLRDRPALTKLLNYPEVVPVFLHAD